MKTGKERRIERLEDRRAELCSAMEKEDKVPWEWIKEVEEINFKLYDYGKV